MTQGLLLLCINDRDTECLFSKKKKRLTFPSQKDRDGPGSPVEKTKSKGSSTQTKGKWLKITRKGLLITAMSRVGKEAAAVAAATAEEPSCCYFRFLLLLPLDRESFFV